MIVWGEEGSRNGPVIIMYQCRCLTIILWIIWMLWSLHRLALVMMCPSFTSGFVWCVACLMKPCWAQDPPHNPTDSSNAVTHDLGHTCIDFAMLPYQFAMLPWKFTMLMTYHSNHCSQYQRWLVQQCALDNAWWKECTFTNLFRMELYSNWNWKCVAII